MRTIFSVGSKLLGIYFAFQGLIYLVGAFALGDGELAPLLFPALGAALAFAFAFVLLFRTDWLAHRVRVHSDASTSIDGLESRVVLRTGIILIGLYVFVTRLGLALITVSSYLTGTRFGTLGGAPVRILIESVPLALAVLFAFRADRIVDLVTRDTAAVG